MNLHGLQRFAIPFLVNNCAALVVDWQYLRGHLRLSNHNSQSRGNVAARKTLGTPLSLSFSRAGFRQASDHRLSIKLFVGFSAVHYFQGILFEDLRCPVYGCLSITRIQKYPYGYGWMVIFSWSLKAFESQSHKWEYFIKGQYSVVTHTCGSRVRSQGWHATSPGLRLFYISKHNAFVRSPIVKFVKKKSKTKVKRLRYLFKGFQCTYLLNCNLCHIYFISFLRISITVSGLDPGFFSFNPKRSLESASCHSVNHF